MLKDSQLDEGERSNREVLAYLRDCVCACALTFLPADSTGENTHTLESLIKGINDDQQETGQLSPKHSALCVSVSE